MQKLSSFYGPVVGFYLGPAQYFVSVCGFEAVRDALYNDDLIGRPSVSTCAGRTFNCKRGDI